jgi:methylmalonyl-CoA mutase N-terminal domain/subunit
MKERFGAQKEQSLMLRFHTQTAGSSLMAQQPLNNVVRTTMQGLAAVLGGTQSLHTNSYDEAIGLPTEQAATLALRTQQIIAYESGVASSADPLAGSYLIEALTDELEAQAKLIIADIDAMGGAVPAIEAGWVQAAIADAAYAYQRNIESHEQVIVGLNKFTDRSDAPIPVFRPDEGVGAEQIARCGHTIPHPMRDEGRLLRKFPCICDQAINAGAMRGRRPEFPRINPGCLHHKGNEGGGPGILLPLPFIARPK